MKNSGRDVSEVPANQKPPQSLAAKGVSPAYFIPWIPGLIVSFLHHAILDMDARNVDFLADKLGVDIVGR